MDLNEIYIFSKVVELGSFSKAARALGMPNSTVSAKVSSLEKRLGTTLIQRTTRRLAITPAGQCYFQRCAIVLKEFAAAEVELTNDRAEPQGLLRITAPVELGNSVLPRLLRPYTAQFPKVSVEAILTDRRVHLLEEGVDLALRAGELSDSSLITKRIAAVGFGVFASPKFAKENGSPRTPAEISNFEAIRFTPLSGKPWVLVGPGGEVAVECRSKFTMNDLNLVKMLAIQHAGFALLPTFFCANEVANKTLVRILPEWTTKPAPLQFVYPAQKFVPARVSAFIQIATEVLREMLRSPST